MTGMCAFFPATEMVVSDTPLVIRRVVRWGDCDPAGIVYTPRFLDYAVSAHEAFTSMIVGGPLHQNKGRFGVDFPVRGVEMDFRSPMPVDTHFEMDVRVGDVRSRTFDLHVTARKLTRGEAAPDGVAFTARLTPITVAPDTRKAVPLPPELKAAILAYRTRHPHIVEDTP